MEQTRGEAQQQEQPTIPLKCPRCNSPDTKFRYFNNQRPTQPRYYCRSCKRQWTVGGNLRNIPVGGKSRSGKQTKASSSRYGNPICQQPLPFGELHLQLSQSLTPTAAMTSQSFHTTMIQTSTNQPSAVFPQGSYYFNDEISCLDAIQSLIHPELINQHVNVSNQINTGGANMTIPEEWIRSMESQQAFHQQIPRYIDSPQIYNQGSSRHPSHLHNNSLVQDISTNFGVPTPNVSLWNNSRGRGDTTDVEMDTTSVNVDEWLNFPDYDQP